MNVTMRTFMLTAALLACATRSFAQAPDALPKVMPLPQTSTAVPAPLPVAAPTTPPMPVPPALVFRAADEARGNMAAKSADPPALPAVKAAGESPALRKGVKTEGTAQKSDGNVSPKKATPKKAAPKKATHKKATHKKATNKKAAARNAATRKKATSAGSSPAPTPKPALAGPNKAG